MATEILFLNRCQIVLSGKGYWPGSVSIRIRIGSAQPWNKFLIGKISVFHFVRFYNIFSEPISAVQNSIWSSPWIWISRIHWQKLIQIQGGHKCPIHFNLTKSEVSRKYFKSNQSDKFVLTFWRVRIPDEIGLLPDLTFVP